MSRTQFFLLLMFVAVLAMVIVAVNSQVISVELVLLQVNMRLGVALVTALAVGLVIGVLLRGLWVAELLTERGRLRRALRVAEAKARSMHAGSAGPQA